MLKYEQLTFDVVFREQCGLVKANLDLNTSGSFIMRLRKLNFRFEQTSKFKSQEKNSVELQRKDLLEILRVMNEDVFSKIGKETCKLCRRNTRSKIPPKNMQQQCRVCWMQRLFSRLTCTNQHTKNVFKLRIKWTSANLAYSLSIWLQIDEQNEKESESLEV